MVETIGLNLTSKNKIYEGGVVPLSPSIGDVYRELDSNNSFVAEWVWNGFFWLSKTKNTDFSHVNIAATSSIILPVVKNQNLFIESLQIDYSAPTTNNSSKYWLFELFRVSDSYGQILIASANSIARYYDSLTLNVNLVDNLINNTIYYLLKTTRASNPSNLNLSGKLTYKIIN